MPRSWPGRGTVCVQAERSVTASTRPASGLTERQRRMTEVVLFDLDSTIADTYHRQWMVPEIKAGNGPTWDDYSMACSDDKPIEGVISMLRMLSDAGKLIFIVTGRSDAARDLTQEWLKQNHVPWDALLMRKAGDRTPNGTYKRAAIKKIEDAGYEPVLFVEDYPAVADEIRATGLPVLLVNPGYPEDAPHQNGAA